MNHESSPPSAPSEEDPTYKEVTPMIESFELPPSDEELGLEPPASTFVQFPCGCVLEVPDEDERHDPEDCLERQDDGRRWLIEQESIDQLAYPDGDSR
jgi:hypothetical protein